jgi:hypothetical protein
MKVAVLLALAGLALAARPHPRRWMPRAVPQSIWGNEEILGNRQISENKFKQGSEFVFVYDAQLTNGVPGSSRQHSGTRLQARCRLQFPEEQKAIVQLEHIHVAQINQMVSSPRSMVPMEACNEVPLQPHQKQILEIPIQFKYVKGMITEVELSAQDQPWSVNIKRGLLNLLQVNLDNKDVIRKRERQEVGANERIGKNLIVPNFDFFTVNETTMEGECETSYTITAQPCRHCSPDQPVLNITKSINFEVCRRRPEIKYNFRFSEVCPTCDKKYDDLEKFLESSTIYRYNISGVPESFLIESAVAESQYVFVPYNEQSNVMVTYTNQTLILVGSGPVQQPLQVPQIQEKSSLVYSPKWDEIKELFQMQQNELFQENTPYAPVENKPKLCFKLTWELKQAIENGQHSHMSVQAPRLMARLVKVMRMLKVDELNACYQEIEQQSPELKKIMKDMTLDCLGMCGTYSCLQQLTNLAQLKDPQMPLYRTSLALKSFTQARVVSKQMIEHILSYCDSPMCQSDLFCKQSCLLTTGSMVGAMCKPNDDFTAIEYEQQKKNQMVESPEQPTKDEGERIQELCPIPLQEELAEKLIKRFDQASDVYEKILMLKTISNAALPACLHKLEKIIINKDESAPHKTMVRVQAIEAVRKLRMTTPKTIQRMLMPIYMNERELPELRMAAVHQLIQTLPERPILDQIARQLVQEKSRNVAGFVFTYLMSMANSTNTCERRMADDLKLSLRHAKHVPYTMLPYLSRYVHLDYYDETIKAGAGLSMGVLRSNVSYVPKDAAVSIDTTVWGFWRKNLLTLGIMQQDVDKFIFEMVGPEGRLFTENPEQLIETGRRARRALDQDPYDSLRDLFSTMKTEERSFYSEQMQDPMAIIYARIFDQEYGMIPLSKAYMGQYFSDNKLSLIEMLNQLRQGYGHSKHYFGTMIKETSRKIPTSIGIPVVFVVKQPTILGVEIEQVKAEIQSFRREQTKAELYVRAKPSIVSNAVISMESWTPVINSGVKAQLQLQAHLPIDTKIEIKTGQEQHSEIYTKIQMAMPQGEYKRRLFTVASQPITYTRVWPRQINEWVEPIEVTIVGEEWDRVRQIEHNFGENSLGVNFELRGQWHRTPKMALAGLPSSILSGPNRIDLYATQGFQQPKMVELEVSGQLFQQLKEKIMPELLKQYYQEPSHREYFETIEFDTDSSEEYEPMQQAQPPKRVDMEQYLNEYSTQESSRHALTLKLRAQSEQLEREAKCSVDYLCTDDNQHCKTKIQCDRTPVPQKEDQPYRVVIETESMYPQPAYTLEQLDEQQKALYGLRVMAGPVGQQKELFNIKMQGERSIEQQNMLENSKYHQFYRQASQREQQPELFSPLAQYDQVIKASALTQFKIHCQYNRQNMLSECPSCMNTTMKLYRLAKHLGYWNMDIDQLVENQPEQIRVQIKLDPKSYQMVNVTCQLPNENSRFLDLPLPVPIFPTNLRHRNMPTLFRPVYEQEENRECKVGTTRIQTFDQVIYRAPLTSCYSVLAKDCSSIQKPKFAVLLKKISQQTEQKKLKILVPGQKITLACEEPSCEQMMVKVNGQQIEINQREQEISPYCVIIREGPYYKVKLPQADVKVFFDGYNVRIKSSPMYQNVQCGLCGDADSEPSNEFTSNDLIDRQDDMGAFFQSYLHKDAECQMTPELETELSQPQRYQYQPLDWEQEEYDSTVSNRNEPWNSFEIENEDYKIKDESPYFSSEQQPILVTKVKQTLDFYCFSKRPVPVCPPGTFDKQVTMTNEPVQYCCLEKSEPAAHRMLRKASRQQVVEEVAQLPASEDIVESQKEVVPKSCVNY